MSTECTSFKTTRNKLQDCSCLQCDPDYVADVLMTRLADDSSEVVDKILDVGQVCKDRAACYLYVYTPRSTLYNFYPLEKLSKKPCFVFDAH